MVAEYPLLLDVAHRRRERRFAYTKRSRCLCPKMYDAVHIGNYIQDDHVVNVRDATHMVKTWIGKVNWKV